MDLHTFRQRLDNTLPRLVSDELLSNTGLGNEIGFYIFDYPPEYELEMRDHIGFLLEQIPKKRPGIRVAHINLFHLLVDYLRDRKLLDRLIARQRKNQRCRGRAYNPVCGKRRHYQEPALVHP